MCALGSSGRLERESSRLRTPWGCARSIRDGITPRGCTLIGAASLSLRLASFVIHSTTRAHVRLLGPCFKTGRVGPDFYSPLWASTAIRPKTHSERRQVTTGQVLLEDAALVEEPKPQNSLTNAPYNRHPVGRGVLLGPPLADLGAANAFPSQRSSRQFRRSLAAKRACNQVPGAGTRSTFEGPPV